MVHQQLFYQSVVLSVILSGGLLSKVKSWLSVRVGRCGGYGEIDAHVQRRLKFSISVPGERCSRYKL